MTTDCFNFDYFDALPAPAPEGSAPDCDVFDALPALPVAHHIVRDRDGVGRVVKGAGMGWDPRANGRRT